MTVSPIFFLDSSILVQMIDRNTEEKADKLTKTFASLKQRGIPIVAFTTLSNYRRAIYLARDSSPLEALRTINEFIVIIPDDVDFRDEDAVLNSMLRAAEIISEKVKTL